MFSKKGIFLSIILLFMLFALNNNVYVIQEI